MSFQKLTLGEVEQIEDLTGLPLGEIFKEGAFPTAKVIARVAFVVRKRTHPDVTLDEIQTMAYDETLQLFADVVGDEEAPKADSPATKSKPAGI